MMPNQAEDARAELAREREGLLDRLFAWLEMPMLVLAFIWLAVFVIEVLWGVTPFLEYTGYIIWALFAFEYVLGFAIAPRKLLYLRRNWLKALALAAPALRLLRLVAIARLARVGAATRGLRLLRLVSSLNRGMGALSRSLGRRGFGYVVMLTLIVLIVGAAGMYAFEHEAGTGWISGYGHALWWTAMILASMGTDAWPRTPEGRLLCLFLALYGFGIFGYVTAMLATFFVGRDAESDDTEIAGARTIAALRTDIAALRAEIGALSAKTAPRDDEIPKAI